MSAARIWNALVENAKTKAAKIVHQKDVSFHLHVAKDVDARETDVSFYMIFENLSVYSYREKVYDL